MDLLPQELLDKIAQLLHHDDLDHALVVSRKFQYAVERVSGRFACFTFKHHSYDELQYFIKVFSNHRFRYLRRVEICTKFASMQRRGIFNQERNNSSPGLHWESITCGESRQELDEKDQMFTRQVASCFEAIKRVEDKAAKTKGARDQASKDKAVENLSRQSTGTIQLEVFTPTRHVDESYCDHRRYSSWRVHLLSPDAFPELYSVSGLSICSPQKQGHHHRQLVRSRIDLRVIIDLASRCPNLEYLGCKFGIDEWTNSVDSYLEHYRHDHVRPSRDTRNDFGQAVLDAKLPSALQYVQLHFISDTTGAINEQRWSPPNLVEPPPYDLFSSSLSLLSLNLKNMELRVMADKTLFWPHDIDKGSTWPNLERLNVMIHIRSPSGSWYFEDPAGIQPRDEDLQPEMTCPHPSSNVQTIRNLFRNRYEPISRIIPVEESLGPLLESFAKAAGRMPRLKRAMLWAPLEYHEQCLSDSWGWAKSNQCNWTTNTPCPAKSLA